MGINIGEVSETTGEEKRGIYMENDKRTMEYVLKLSARVLNNRTASLCKTS